jgi:hypothetical protein
MRRPDDVELVDKQDDLTLRVGDLLQHLEALLELAAVALAISEPCPARRSSCSSGLRDVAADDPPGQPSTIAVLPTPGSPMSTGLFLVRRDRTWMTRRISSRVPDRACPCARAPSRSRP